MWRVMVEHSQSISGLANILMVLIWVFYLHVFMLQFRRQKRPFLVIHHAHGLSPSANCLLVNMSQETVHVQCVLARITTQQGEYLRQVDSYQHQSEDGTSDGGQPTHRLREGPLRPGGYLMLGNFDDILLAGATELAEPGEAKQADGEVPASSGGRVPGESGGENTAPGPPSAIGEVDSLEICVAAVHGPSSHPVGARRRFVVESHAGQPLIRPQNIHTEQLTTFRKRRRVRSWVEQCLNPQQRGPWQTQQSGQSAE